MISHIEEKCKRMKKDSKNNAVWVIKIDGKPIKTATGRVAFKSRKAARLSLRREFQPCIDADMYDILEEQKISYDEANKEALKIYDKFVQEHVVFKNVLDSGCCGKCHGATEIFG